MLGDYFSLLYKRKGFLTKITNLVIKITIFPHGEKSEILFLPYVLDLIHLLEQNFCRDSNLRVKTMFESVK